RDGTPRTLDPGLYGLSNGFLDTPWPKVRRAKMLLNRTIRSGNIAPEPLLDLLRDEERPADDELPRTGLEMDVERRASAIFIADPTYGTRASTVVLIDRSGGVTFVERSYGPEGAQLGTETFRFDVDTNGSAAGE
ncbi:MAG: NRDE family protein, partial [Rhodothermales bacterium]